MWRDSLSGGQQDLQLLAITIIPRGHANSNRRAGLSQKIPFLRSAGSTENAIAMGKAAEAGNGLMVIAHRLDKGRFVRMFRQRGKQAHSRLLVGEALAVL